MTSFVTIHSAALRLKAKARAVATEIRVSSAVMMAELVRQSEAVPSVVVGSQVVRVVDRPYVLLIRSAASVARVWTSGLTQCV